MTLSTPLDVTLSSLLLALIGPNLHKTGDLRVEPDQRIGKKLSTVNLTEDGDFDEMLRGGVVSHMDKFTMCCESWNIKLKD